MIYLNVIKVLIKQSFKELLKWNAIVHEYVIDIDYFKPDQCSFEANSLITKIHTGYVFKFDQFFF